MTLIEVLLLIPIFVASAMVAIEAFEIGSYQSAGTCLLLTVGGMLSVPLALLSLRVFVNEVLVKGLAWAGPDPPFRPDAACTAAPPGISRRAVTKARSCGAVHAGCPMSCAHPRLAPTRCATGWQVRRNHICGDASGGSGRQSKEGPGDRTGNRERAGLLATAPSLYVA